MSRVVDELEKLSNAFSSIFEKPFRGIDRALENVLRRDIGRSITRRLEDMTALGLRKLRHAIEAFERARSERAKRKAYNEVLYALYGKKGARVLRKAVQAGIITEEELVSLTKKKLRRKAVRIRPHRRSKHGKKEKKKKKKHR